MMEPINHNQSRNPRTMMTQDFLPSFTCLPASQSSLWRFTHLEVHALIGITSQTLNRVPYNQHKMRITQATRNPLKLPFVISHGEGTRTPHNVDDRSRQQSPIAAQQSTNHRVIQVSANTKSNKNSTSPNHPTTTTDARTLSNALEALQSHSR